MYVYIYYDCFGRLHHTISKKRTWNFGLRFAVEVAFSDRRGTCSVPQDPRVEGAGGGQGRGPGWRVTAAGSRGVAGAHLLLFRVTSLQWSLTIAQRRGSVGWESGLQPVLFLVQSDLEEVANLLFSFFLTVSQQIQIGAAVAGWTPGLQDMVF